MSEKIADFSLEQNLTALQEVFADYSGAVYLRGSLLRQEPPYDDLDVIEIGSTKSQAQEHMPGSFRGAKIAYRHLGLSEWGSYLSDCPRSWYMFYDIASLRHEEGADEIIEAERNAFFASKEPDFVAYNHRVFLASKGEPVDLSINDYEYAKKIPGSKRSIMRSVFTLKALYPGHRSSTTPELLEQCVLEGNIPEHIPPAVQGVYRALSRNPVDARSVASAAEPVDEWMGAFASKVDSYLAERLPSTYLSLLGKASLSDSSVDLIDAYQNFPRLELPYRQWTLAYLLTRNRHLPQTVVVDIADYYKSGYIGRVIRDNLGQLAIDQSA